MHIDFIISSFWLGMILAIVAQAAIAFIFSIGRIFLALRALGGFRAWK